MAWGFCLLVSVAPQGFVWHIKSMGSCLNALSIFNSIQRMTKRIFAIATTIIYFLLNYFFKYLNNDGELAPNLTLNLLIF